MEARDALLILSVFLIKFFKLSPCWVVCHFQDRFNVQSPLQRQPTTDL